MFVCLKLSSIVEAVSRFIATPNKINNMVKPHENSGKLSMSTFFFKVVLIYQMGNPLNHIQVSILTWSYDLDDLGC